MDVVPLTHEAESSNTNAQQGEHPHSSPPTALDQADDGLAPHDATEALVYESTEQVRALSAALVQAEEWERQRIAKRLHGQLQPLLHGLQMRMQLLTQDVIPFLDDEQQTQLVEIDALIEDAIEQVRTCTRALSPPVSVEDNLSTALEWLAYEMQGMYALTVDFRTTGDTHIPNRAVRILIYQCVRELLVNVVKHSGVEHATIHIFRAHDQAVVQVEDEGFGFLHGIPGAEHPPHDGGWGLATIRERLQLIGGRLAIDSQVGRGARISLFIPL